MDWLRTLIIFALWFSCGHCVLQLTIQRDQLASPNPIYRGHRLAIYCRLPSDDLLAKKSNNDQGLVRANIKKIKYIYIGYETSKDSNKWHRIAHIRKDGRVELGMFPNFGDRDMFAGLNAYTTGRGSDLGLWAKFDVGLHNYQKYVCRINLQTKHGDRGLSIHIHVTRKFENIVTINPVTIGEPMEVRCSVHTIGGIGQLYEIGPKRMFNKLKLLRKLTKGNTRTDQMLVTYCPICKSHLVKEFGKDLPKGVTQDDFSFTGKATDNVTAVRIVMRVKRAEYEHVTPYVCEYKYFEGDDPDAGFKRLVTKVFKEETKVMDKFKYKVYTTKSSHSDARKACQDKGGMLAQPKTLWDHTAMLQAIDVTPGTGIFFWLGISREREGSAWKYLDGVPLGDWNHWAHHHPNDIEKDKDCVKLLIPIYNMPGGGQNLGGWSNTRCNEEYQYVCEFEHVNIVTPNPIAIGGAMEVKCSVDSIGGIDMLASIVPVKIVSKMILSQIIAGKSQVIARYRVFEPTIRKEIVFRPKGTIEITMGGGQEERYPNAGNDQYPNVDTINMTMKMDRATCDHVATYKCQLWYDIPTDQAPPPLWRTWTKAFTQDTTAVNPAAKTASCVVQLSLRTRNDHKCTEIGQENRLFCSVVSGSFHDSIWNWFKGEELIPKTQNKKSHMYADRFRPPHVSEPTLTLHFDKVQLTDNGVYHCRQGAFRSAYIKVQPYIKTRITSKADQYGTLGQDGAIECALGELTEEQTKELNIWWYKNNRKIVNGAKYSINTTHLTIKNLNDNDTGQYKCSVHEFYCDSNAKLVVNFQVHSLHHAASRGDGKPQPPALLVPVVLGLCQLIHYM